MKPRRSIDSKMSRRTSSRRRVAAGVLKTGTASITSNSSSCAAGESQEIPERKSSALAARSLLALYRLHASPELELQVMAELPAPFLSASLARIRVADAHLVQLRFPRLARLTNRVRHRSSHLPSRESSQNSEEEAHLCKEDVLVSPQRKPL